MPSTRVFTYDETNQQVIFTYTATSSDQTKRLPNIFDTKVREIYFINPLSATGIICDFFGPVPVGLELGAP